jgi:hypothetical protein
MQQGASFYRVDYINASTSFVVQFGYRGDPTVDACWDQNLTSNTTWSVHPPGNQRGAVAFSMNAINNTGAWRRGGRGGGSGGDGAHLVIRLVAVVLAVVDVTSGLCSWSALQC